MHSGEVLSCPRPGREACQQASNLFSQVHASQESGRDPESGIRAIEGILRLCPDCPHALSDWTRLLITQGAFDTARSVADRLLAQPTDHEDEATFLRGIVALNVEGKEQAVSWFRRSLKTGPVEHEPNCALADTMLSLGKTAEAFPFVQMAWATEPTEELANYNLLFSLRMAGDERRLAKALAHASALKPTRPALWDEVARGYDRLGKPKKALAFCELALRVDSDFVPLVCQSAYLEYRLGFSVRAERSLLRLLELDPEHHRSYALLGLANLACFKRRDYRTALERVVEARNLFPNDERVHRAYESIVDVILGTISAAEAEKREAMLQYEAMHREHDALASTIQAFQPDEQGVPLGIALQRLEGQDIEFIDRFPSRADDLAKEIAAFCTSNDGSIFLGVADDGTVVGLDGLDSPKARDALQNRIAGITSGTVVPPAPVDVYFRDRSGALVVKIFVPKGREPVYYVRSTPYIRHLDQSRPASHEEVKQLVIDHAERLRQQ